MPQIPEIAKCPEHLMPSKQWEDAFLVEFSELRMVCFFWLVFSCLLSSCCVVEQSIAFVTIKIFLEIEAYSSSYNHTGCWSILSKSKPHWSKSLLV